MPVTWAGQTTLPDVSLGEIDMNASTDYEAVVSRLIAEATQARQNAYTPYSRFAVGAALLAKTGGIFTGCNVENASYGLTICGERVAIGCAIASGEREFAALAIVTDSPEPTVPCGACLQVLSEFADDLLIISENLEGKRIQTTLRELLPQAFKRY
jgi:cytidine deaminase